MPYEKKKNDEKWMEQTPTHQMIKNTSNENILNTFNSEFSELEKALTFNGELMEQLQRTLSTVLEYNKA